VSYSEHAYTEVEEQAKNFPSREFDIALFVNKSTYDRIVGSLTPFRSHPSALGKVSSRAMPRAMESQLAQWRQEGKCAQSLDSDPRIDIPAFFCTIASQICKGKNIELRVAPMGQELELVVLDPEFFRRHEGDMVKGLRKFYAALFRQAGQPTDMCLMVIIGGCAGQDRHWGHQHRENLTL